MSGKANPRSSRRQEAQTSSRRKDQSLVTSAATLHEEAPPYRIGQNARNARNEIHSAHSVHSVSALRFIDLFCGIGGFRLAFERAGARCVFSSDWDKFSRQTYAANFHETSHGDIHEVAGNDYDLRKIFARCSARNVSSGNAASSGRLSA